MRIPQSEGFSKFILAVGVIWGTVAFFLGCIGSFAASLGNDGRQITKSLLALIFGFLIILPITLAASWIPRISAGLLVVSFLVFECVVISDVGFQGFLTVALKLGVPTCALTGGYVYVACVRAKSLRSKIAEPMS